MIVIGDTPVPAAAALADAKAYLRLDGSGEDALLAGLIATATALCERFVAQPLVARGFVEILPVACAWQALARRPVSAITAVTGLAGDGSTITFPVDAYAIDIDAAGDGWVRVVRQGAAGRIEVTYQAGLAADAAGVPEPLRQGVLRLVAHLFAHRDEIDEGAPPAAIAALWRPYRRMRLA